MTSAKILFFDIETTHLKADFGTVLCVGYKHLGERKPTLITLTDYAGWKRDVTDDRRVVRDFYPILRAADIWVSYFGTGFDVKFLQAKLLEHGLDVPPNTPHVDLFYTVKSNLALSRKSLANVAEFLQLPAEKTPVKGRTWKQAMVGNQAAIRYVKAHCAADVTLLEQAYLRLRPLVRTHPRVSGYGPCRACGSAVRGEGFRATTTKGAVQRVRCVSCGSWDTRTLSKGVTHT